VLPLLVVAALHLRLKEPPEFALYRPSYPVSFLISALYYVLTVGQNVRIDPYALSKNGQCNFLRHLVLFGLCSLNYSPKTLTTTMSMFAERSGSDCQTWRVLKPLKFFLS